MAKDFSSFLGPKKKKKINLTTNKSKQTKKDAIKTSSKVVANYEQTDGETSSKVVANYEQTDGETSSKVVANYKQTSSMEKHANPKTGSKVVAQPVAQVVANYKQTLSLIHI